MDRLKFLQHVNKVISRSAGDRRETWVYDEAHFIGGNDQALDFVCLTLQEGSLELLSHYLSMERALSERYKDYLLLCASDRRIDSVWRRKLLELGANPNATFYFGLQDRVKTSPWLQYLVDANEKRYSSHGSDVKDPEDIPDNDLDMDTLDAFLDKGASLEDRTVICKELYYGRLRSVKLRDVPWFRGDPSYVVHILFVIEVNAKYLLEEQCRPGRVGYSARGASVLSRADVQKARSHRQVLAIHRGWGTSFFAEIDCPNSEEVLNGLMLVPHLAEHSLGDEDQLKNEEMLSIWRRSPKFEDVKQYLEDKGYYKKKNDPAVPQRPIPMFGDEE